MEKAMAWILEERRIGYLDGFTLAGLICLLTACYLFYFVRRLPIGVTRLIASLPVLIIYGYLPLIFDRRTQVLGIAILSGIVTWAASFKVLMFCWGFGPLLVSNPAPAIDSNLWAFTAVLSTPVRVHPNPIKGRRAAAAASAGAVGKLLSESRRAAAASTTKSGSGQKEAKVETWTDLVIHSAIKFIMVVAGVIVIADYKEKLPGYVFTFLNAFVINSFVGLVEEGLGALITATLKVQLLKHVDHPYLSTSHSDFWARRWHLTVSVLLRESVYEPMMLLFHILLAPSPSPSSSPSPSPSRGDSLDNKVVEERMKKEAEGVGGINGGVSSSSTTPRISAMAAEDQVLPDRLRSSKSEIGKTTAISSAVHNSGIRFRSSQSRCDVDEGKEEKENKEHKEEEEEEEEKMECSMSRQIPDNGRSEVDDGGGRDAPGGHVYSREETGKEQQRQQRAATFRVPMFAQLIAVMAAFFVSGVMHEMMLWYMTRTATWQFASFFWLAGIVVCIEFGLRRLPCSRAVKPPRVVSIIFTIGSLMVMGEMLFFPPLVQTGAVAAVMHEMRNFVYLLLRI